MFFFYDHVFMSSDSNPIQLIAQGTASTSFIHSLSCPPAPITQELYQQVEHVNIAPPRNISSFFCSRKVIFLDISSRGHGVFRLCDS